ncbi:unnamed protein product [Microthlaspi erraticum]|uniref:MADS-box domain-containing protein n=1 Tax=Microthlaspi erraticum TaxID=1685480 RepID=A0A6D2KTB8_9BRAS|nr:unnamed protein product [Microthlaspi erraticum]
MTRSKVKLEFISNDASRKNTFRKRNKGLLKKVNELSTLCGIPACAIIYSPYNTNPTCGHQTPVRTALFRSSGRCRCWTTEENVGPRDIHQTTHSQSVRAA